MSEAKKELWKSPKDVDVLELEIKEAFERGPFEGKLDLIVHHKDPKTGKVVRKNPYRQFVGKGRPSIYEQPVDSGIYYYDSDPKSKGSRRVNQWKDLPESHQKALIWKKKQERYDAYQVDLLASQAKAKAKVEEDAIKSRLRKEIMADMNKRPLSVSKPAQAVKAPKLSAEFE